MKVGLLSIATGKYTQFIEPLYRSVEQNFLVDHSKVYVIFTDNVKEVAEITSRLNLDAEIFEIKRKGFPGDTLYRYHHFFSARERLKKRGNDCPKALFYMDADMLVVDRVGDEVLPTRYKPIVATAHPGYYDRHGHNPLGTPETRPASTAFIPNDRRRPCYWAGGFNGGEFESFMSLSAAIMGRIDKDDSSNITAVWHDESHLNAYISEHWIIGSVKTMTPSYCLPEYDVNKGIFLPKIVALVKDHKEVRNEA